jgi:sulfonate transport system permease protein
MLRAASSQRTHRPPRWLGAVLPLVIGLAWLVATSVTHRFPPHQLPSPGQVGATVWQLASDGELARHVLASVGRVLAGFALGASLAIALGTLVGLSRTVEAIVDPTLQLLRNIPSLAWVPFLLLWMGIDEAPKIALIAIGAAFPVYLNLVAGIRQTDRALLEVGQVFGMTRLELVGRIVWPSAFPYLLTGLRIAIGQSWLFLVAAELIASTRGLGFLLIDAENTARPNVMVVGILVLALLGKLSDSALRTAGRLVVRWSDARDAR